MRQSFLSMPTRDRTERVAAVCSALHSLYGDPRLGNPEDPVDDLVYIVLSNKTREMTATTAYRALKAEYPSWERLAGASHDQLARLLHPCGLAGVRAEQLIGTMEQLIRDFGSCHLDALRSSTDSEVLAYLRTLPGVSEKVAKCVMMYTLDRGVLPVDTHVHRIASRLGWTNKRRLDQCGRELEELVPSARRYAFHVDCIVHGRLVCRARSPHCAHCCLYDYCEFGWRKNASRG